VLKERKIYTVKLFEMKKKALIIGVTGQDGTLLSNFLFKKNYKIWGTSRFIETSNFESLKTLKILNKINIVKLNTENFTHTYEFIDKIKPNEIYFLGGQSSVGYSYLFPNRTLDSNIKSFVNILESSKKINSKIKIFYAGSSECFGETKKRGANEKTKFNPISPYAISKVTSIWLSDMYRSSYDMFVSNGILFNHESSLRPKKFVTKKIITAAYLISKNKRKKLSVGDINISRDWGWAEEYVKAMWLILQQPKSENFVIGTGKSNSLKKFIELAFNQFGLNWEDHVEINEKFIRPNDILYSCANPKKANEKLGWSSKLELEEIISRISEDIIL
tara:strand:- start:4329 stop:5327 length:999 start_codon:yes stop_codon:yes gene_type:complete